MPDHWSVEWSADAAGYHVLVCNRCRIVRKFSAACLEGESLADVRMQAAARAVELALEYRVPPAEVREVREPIGGGARRALRSDL